MPHPSRDANRRLTFGSLFTGIGGFDLGFERAGLRCAWQVEINAPCREVLARHWPDTERYEDVRQIGAENVPAVDLLCGGFPCQDVSVAGRREGLAGERSGLWREFARLIADLGPRWVVIENVPGLLSSNGGRDMGTVLGALGQLGYRWAYRVLDAQYYGVAQRRRRVFIVGHSGDGRAAEVLFESASSAWDPAARRQEGARVAALTRNGVGTCGADDNQAQAGHLVADGPARALTCNAQGGGVRHDDQTNYVVANAAITASAGHHGHSSPRGDGSDNLVIGFDRTRGTASGDVTAPLRVCGARSQGVNDAKADTQCVVFNWQSGGDVRLGISKHRTTALHANQTPAVMYQGVRRLTPTECERLQGFPDGWTAGQSDTQRYRQLGNAVCVPVAEWIGRRIVEVSYA